ncbi:MAG: hypothetical protein KGL93_13800 [Gemmatimonadota bacterium]|nr:hypothetical protein [Gemmatimonadota bacterium]
MHESRVRARARALPPAFLEELARPDLPPAATYAAIAGLIVLRAVDRWAAAGCRPLDDLAGAQNAVAALDAGNPARSILGGALDAMTAPPGDAAAVIDRIAAYARHLEFDARYALALQVHRSILAYRGFAATDAQACESELRGAFCLRMLARLDEARDAYDRAERDARRIGSARTVLRAALGRALVLMMRGRLDEADAAMRDLETRAMHDDFPDVLATVLHNRAIIAGMQGRPARAAVELAFRALRLTPDPANRERVLFDIGESLRRAGLRAPARDAFLILSCTAQERHLREHALVMLMRIAADDGAREMFEHYARLIDPQEFHVRLRLEHRLQRGYALRALGDLAGSRAEFEGVAADAAAAGQGLELQEAQRALAGSSDAVDVPAPDTLSRLADVVESLKTMREAAVSV